MWKHLPSAAGYLAIFIVPGLLVLGVSVDAPSLAFGTVMLVFPLMRPVFGSVLPANGVLWNEPLALALERLPLLYAAALASATALVLRHLALQGIESLSFAIGLGLSLWMTMLFSTCVSHELIHRRKALDTVLGHCIAGLAGYPVLAQEHLAHHARSGDTGCADWPRESESVWRFAFRRGARVFEDAYAPGSSFWNTRARGRSVFLLRLGTFVSVAAAALFAWAGGWGGLVLYLCVAFGVWFGVQLITYIQHWGLGDDRLGENARHGYGWEDDCRFQAWLTLSISLHNGHHQHSRLPYYRIELTPNSPRLPAGYVVLMVLCLFPAPWFRVMRPVLEHWESDPGHPRSPGRRLTCFSLYGDRSEVVSR
jgi:alkane 1-monooxygenase